MPVALLGSVKDTLQILLVAEPACAFELADLTCRSLEQRLCRCLASRCGNNAPLL